MDFSNSRGLCALYHVDQEYVPEVEKSNKLATFDLPKTSHVREQRVAVGWWILFAVCLAYGSFARTTLSYWHIRRRQVEAHRHWMLRSYAISLFFITFPIWVPTLQGITADAIAWPVGLLLAVSMNVIAAGWWIRYS